MFRKAIVVRYAVVFVLAALGFAALFGQKAFAQQSNSPTSTPPSVSAGSEFPVNMRQNVTAGNTPVGTKVQAKLVVATMVNGVVVPRDATLSGEVTESVKKTKTDPSHLGIRLDLAEWKGGSSPIKVYLTTWYYPEETMAGQDLSYQPQGATDGKRNWNGQGAYPDPSNPISQQKFPGRNTDKDKVSEPTSTASNISKHRILMKNIESSRTGDGAVALISSHSNIKVDRLTTYVFAAGGALPLN